MQNVSPTHAQLLTVLRSTFGFAALRPLQEEIIGDILRRQDVFVLMPTGGGKSLCYQLPGVLQPGLTVVVSPLIALMKDQVDRLQSLGVAATFINSSLEPAEWRKRMADVRQKKVKLLYVAPERLMMPGFIDLLSQADIALFAIDEAHCISEWGHDFRPDYRDLSRLRDLFPSAPIAAFTATATQRVQADIVTQLRLRDAATFRGNLDRPNIYYQVWPKQAAYERLRDYLSAHIGSSGIIYVGARATADRLAARLQGDGFQAVAYHAGLPAEERQLRQEALIRDEAKIVVATIAFGMGIDKPDIRFVIHFDMPKNLEGYYQESGRAGRDGKQSDAILFYTYGDAVKQEYFIRQKPSAAEQRIAETQLAEMVKWAEGTTCRREMLLAYFDDAPSKKPTPCCDICDPPASEETDCTAPAQMLLSCAKRTGESFGVTYLVRVLVGSRDKRILENGHQQLSTYGIGKGWTRQEWQHMARELLRKGLLRLNSERFNAVEVTALGDEVLFRGRKVSLPAAPGATPDPDRQSPAPKKKQAKPDKTYDEGMAAIRAAHPHAYDTWSQEEETRLTDLYRSGATVADIAKALLRGHGAIRSRLLRLNLPAAPEATLDPVQPPPAQKKPEKKVGGPGDSVRATLELFQQGLTPVEIATERGMAAATIEVHLAEAIEAGEPLDLRRLVSDEKRTAIEAALDLMGPGPLKPLKEALGDAYTYAEIRYVRAGKSQTSPR